MRGFYDFYGMKGVCRGKHGAESAAFILRFSDRKNENGHFLVVHF